jgi:hypothetical protein
LDKLAEIFVNSTEDEIYIEIVTGFSCLCQNSSNFAKMIANESRLIQKFTSLLVNPSPQIK